MSAANDAAATSGHAATIPVAAMLAAMKRLATFALGSLAAAGVLAALAIAVWVYVVGNVEEPDYDLVLADGPIEIRDYPALVMAEVVRRGERDAAVRAGFRPLARYIFARDREGESIAMTAPVTQTREEAEAAESEGEMWRVRFIMPASYTLETLPSAVGDDVRLVSAPAARRAAIRFSGVATDALVAENEAALRAWLAERGIATFGPATYAYYNDPLTPGPLRRNEIILDLAAAGD